MKCGQIQCSKEAAPHQKYCSRAHAPYGYLGIALPTTKGKRTKSGETGKYSSNRRGGLYQAFSVLEPGEPFITRRISTEREIKRENPSTREVAKIETTPKKEAPINPCTDQRKLEGVRQELNGISREEILLEPHKGNVMQRTEMMSGEKNENVGLNDNLPVELVAQKLASDEVRSISMSSIDGCTNRLLELMDSFKHQPNKDLGYQDVNAICNCAKNVASLQRLKLELIRVK